MLIIYLCNRYKNLVKAEIYNWCQDFNSYDKILKNDIDIKMKYICQFLLFISEIHVYCIKNQRQQQLSQFKAMKYQKN